MDTNRKRNRSARIIGSLAAAALLTGGVSCLAAAPATAAEKPALDLGFDVAAIATTPDGGVLAVGTSYDADVPRAVLVKDGVATPITGLPGQGDFSAVTVRNAGTAAVAVIGGADADGAGMTWQVDLTGTPAVDDQTPLSNDDYTWGRVKAGSTNGDVTVFAGHGWDSDGDDRALLIGDGLYGAVELPADVEPSAVALGAGDSPTAYVVTSDDDDNGQLWTVAADGNATSHEVGDDPSAVAVAGDHVFVADYGDQGAEIREIDATTGATIATLPFQDSTVRALATSGDGSKLYATATGYGSTQIYVVPVDGFAGFHGDARFWSGDSLYSLAVSEAGTNPAVFSTAADDDGDRSTLVEFDDLPELPGPTAAPTFTGTVQVGQTLTATSGGTGWPDGTQITYGWDVSGGEWGNHYTGRTIKLTADMANTVVRIDVTGSKDGFEDHNATSAWVKVTPAAAKPLPALPVRNAKKATPKVTGAHKVGKTVKAALNHRAWPKGTKVHYRWLANGKPIKGATKSHLKLTKKLKGKRITVVATGTKAGYAPTVKKSKPFRVK